MNRRLAASRRGGVYLAVLGAAMVVTIVGLSAMSVARLEFLAGETGVDAVRARAAAESALELGMLEMQSNALWRTTNVNGAWRTDCPIGGGATYTLEGRDPSDGNLSNNNRDPVVLRGVGVSGQARHIVEVTMVDSGTAVSALTSALAAAGDLQVSSGRSLRVSGAPVTSNATLRNNGTINGDAAALLIVNLGTITGSSSILSLPRSMPDPSVVSMYAKLGTAISPGSTLERVVLSPKYTSLGPTNEDGIYVVNAGGNLTIRDLRVDGTLVVLAPGSTVTVDSRVFMTNNRPDCPALIVQGDLVLRYDSTSTLNEGSGNPNFNPSGAPYNGQEDNDQADTYPSEIRGVVHATGRITMQQTARVVGCVIGQSPALLTAVQIDGTNEIVYDPRVLETPPMGYSTSPVMRPRAGTWKQVTLP